MRRRELVTGAAALAAYAQLPKSAKAAFTLGSLGAGFGQGVASSAPVPVWAKVQSQKSTASASVSSVNVSFPATVTSGNIVVGGVLLATGTRLASVTDDKTNTYDLVNSDGGTSSSLEVAGFKSRGALTNTPQTLTLTFTNAASTTIWVLIDEFKAGFALPVSCALDGAQIWLNNTAAAQIPFRTFQPNDLLYSAIFSTSADLAVGSGWTAAQGATSQQMSMWKQGVASGLVTPAYTSAGTIWASAFAVRSVAINNWWLRQNNIQRSATNVPASGTASVSFNIPMAAGSIGLGAIALGTAAGADDSMANLTSLLDDKGHAWPLVGTNTLGRAIYWSGGAINNGAQTLTATVNHTEVILFFLLNEFVPPPGTSTFATDGGSTIAGSGSSPYTLGPLTTTHNGDLIYGYLDASGTGPNSWPVDGFYSLNGQQNTWNDSWQPQASAGSISAQENGGNTPFSVGFAAISAS